MHAIILFLYCLIGKINKYTFLSKYNFNYQQIRCLSIYRNNSIKHCQAYFFKGILVAFTDLFSTVVFKKFIHFEIKPIHVSKASKKQCQVSYIYNAFQAASLWRQFFQIPSYKWGPYWREALNRVITVFKSEVSWIFGPYPTAVSINFEVS